jgi:hypothetical protein
VGGSARARARHRVLCRHARDGSKRDWGKHIDTHLARAQQQLDRRPVSYARVAETLIAGGARLRAPGRDLQRTGRRGRA